MIGCVWAVVASAIPAWATTYTSASYVQDGLIAQWDAIDNEGTGTHNPNATVWKDLKGNRDLTLQGNGTWRRAGLQRHHQVGRLRREHARAELAGSPLPTRATGQ